MGTSNSGTFQLNGDETLISGSLSILKHKNSRWVRSNFNYWSFGLANVEFNSSGQTFTLGEDMNYITGDVTIASGTTLDALVIMIFP